MEQRISIERMEQAVNLFGSFDENIRLLESELHVTVVNRGGELVISGVVDTERQGVRLVHGMGQVWARTWYDLSVLVPLQTTKRTQQEGETTRIWLDIGKKQINLYAKGSMLPADCGKILHYGAVCLPGGFRLPLTVVTEQTVRYQTQRTERPEA